MANPKVATVVFPFVTPALLCFVVIIQADVKLARTLVELLIDVVLLRLGEFSTQIRE